MPTPDVPRQFIASTTDDLRAYRDAARDAAISADIRRMVRNPVMLTALAVVDWNERRLPEQRADLYDSIIT